ncbi:MAG TPA: hypothetical protein VGE22_04695 [Solimonas sp.]
MDSLWPWLAVAGLGALHGLNPAGGWMFAAACARQEDGRVRVRRALPPLALGHAASIAVVAWLLRRGVTVDFACFEWMAGALAFGAALHCLLRGPERHRALGRDAGPAGLTLWSFLMTSAQGTGLMLIPALSPMCLPGRTSGTSASLALPLLALLLHLGAMLFTTSLLARGACRALPALPHQAWPATLALTGLLLIAWR